MLVGFLCLSVLFTRNQGINDDDNNFSPLIRALSASKSTAWSHGRQTCPAALLFDPIFNLQHLKKWTHHYSVRDVLQLG